MPQCSLFSFALQVLTQLFINENEDELSSAAADDDDDQDDDFDDEEEDESAGGGELDIVGKKWRGQRKPSAYKTINSQQQLRRVRKMEDGSVVYLDELVSERANDRTLCMHTHFCLHAKECRDNLARRNFAAHVFCLHVVHFLCVCVGAHRRHGEESREEEIGGGDEDPEGRGSKAQG